jgi:hypothetical protein
VVKQAAPWLLGIGLLLWVGVFAYRKIKPNSSDLAAVPAPEKTKRRK